MLLRKAHDTSEIQHFKKLPIPEKVKRLKESEGIPLYSQAYPMLTSRPSDSDKKTFRDVLLAFPEEDRYFRRVFIHSMHVYHQNFWDDFLTNRITNDTIRKRLFEDLQAHDVVVLDPLTKQKYKKLMKSLCSKAQLKEFCISNSNTQVLSIKPPQVPMPVVSMPVVPSRPPSPRPLPLSLPLPKKVTPVPKEKKKRGRPPGVQIKKKKPITTKKLKKGGGRGRPPHFSQLEFQGDYGMPLTDKVKVCKSFKEFMDAMTPVGREKPSLHLYCKHGVQNDYVKKLLDLFTQESPKVPAMWNLNMMYYLYTTGREAFAIATVLKKFKHGTYTNKILYVPIICTHPHKAGQKIAGQLIDGLDALAAHLGKFVPDFTIDRIWLSSVQTAIRAYWGYKFRFGALLPNELGGTNVRNFETLKAKVAEMFGGYVVVEKEPPLVRHNIQEKLLERPKWKYGVHFLGGDNARDMHEDGPVDGYLMTRPILS